MRWSQQGKFNKFLWLILDALVGSTLYIYGGRSTTSVAQTSNTWSTINPKESLTVDNYFISLDLSESFSIASPPLTGLSIPPTSPNGPPAISLGALWASSDSNYLYQFAGEFSDNPSASPSTGFMWRYDIIQGLWSLISTNGDQITRPAEGASCQIPGQGTNGEGLGVYLGGHLDAYTVPGWSIQIAREYLQSMVIFDIVYPIANLANIRGLSRLQTIPFHLQHHNKLTERWFMFLNLALMAEES
jgi:hypothetical protein